MRPILVIQNDEDVPPGYLLDVLETAPVEYEFCRPYAGDDIPGTEPWQGVIVLGGAMGVYDADAHPYLHAERELLESLVAAGVPVLGICLGGQLLADALGGKAFRSPRVEARFEVLTSAEARGDVALGELDGPQLSFHKDTWEPPPGAVALLESDQYPQAFRIGSALALQTHPEVTPDIARSWMEGAEGRSMLDEAGVGIDAILPAIEAAQEASAEMANRFFIAWIAEALGSA